MNINRRHALQQLGALALFASPSIRALGQEPGTFTVLKNPVSVEAGGKIEVLEFFHYACNHCRDFDPALSKWLEKLPDDVAFSRVPAPWNPALEELGRLYYALQAVKRLDLHEKIFAAVQEERLPLNRPETVREWVGRHKLDVPAFMDAYQSFGVQTQVQRTKQLYQSYRVDAVPTMAVGGRFLTSMSLAKGRENTLRVVDQLIDKVRRKQVP
ncbi:MAG: thiol:disulfide interchange protein DsbA/DsbL [Azoarcus sp.]|jgi:thiol:disulfide interchange protein DsbA|nr:thiol:disulfide interchange protein DsbA/DsbL [Azoarcus sp.]